MCERQTARDHVKQKEVLPDVGGSSHQLDEVHTAQAKLNVMSDGATLRHPEGARIRQNSFASGRQSGEAEASHSRHKGFIVG